jgi:hypothetical protein
MANAGDTENNRATIVAVILSPDMPSSFPSDMRSSGGGAAGGEARLEHRERLGVEIVGRCLKPAVQNVGLSIDGECKTHHLLLRSVPLH